MTLSHVYDTFVKTKNGKIMHFDVVLDEQDQHKALSYAKDWVSNLGYPDAVVTQENCTFCHSAEATPEIRKQIDEQGYAIYKLEGCPQ